MLDYFGKLNKNVIDQILYRGTMVTGEIITDNGDGTYNVKIAQSDKAYPSVETAFPDMVFGIGEIVLITLEYGKKEMPRILGYAKKIAQHPVDAISDYSGDGGDPITTVETLDAYLVVGDTTHLEARISLSEGAGNCTRRGFRYGTTTGYGSDIHEDGEYGDGPYAIKVEGLTYGTIYHFQAYVIDADDNEQVGEDRTFITPSTIIDVGSVAINRLSSVNAQLTYIVKENPANISGIITSVEIWCNSDMYECSVATFYEVSPGHFSTRDTQVIGTVTAGSKQIIPVSLIVVAGDYIGVNCTAAGWLDKDSGGEGYWWHDQDRIPCTNKSFNFTANVTLSLYGIAF